MTRQIISIIIFVVLGSIKCKNNNTSKNNNYHIDKLEHNFPTEEIIDLDFTKFIKKFSNDSTFQINRTRFPLKVKWNIIETDKDSIFYIDRLNYKLINFNIKKSSGKFDKWEQKIKIAKNNIFTTIEVRGIDNGISIDYLFEKINGAWMFVEIYDSST